MDELYVLARRVLLDALVALGTHREACVLVGAQAVYLRVGEADLAVAAFTTDGDLVVDPRRLATAPPLEQALRAAGFVPRAGDAVGAWTTRRNTAGEVVADVSIDLMVPEAHKLGPGRRSVRLPGHDPRVARQVRGLEGALVDADVLHLAALEPSDARGFDLRIAGPAALLVAKLHKVQERRSSPRLNDKDALDVLRLLRGTATDDLTARLRLLLADPHARNATRPALPWLRELFGERRGAGIAMAQRATGGLVDEAEIEASCLALAGDLLRAMGC
ncbi:MAG TPA: GSU2403 family nucleotidyltransferase fold protein [Planctomycetota bacterium]|nr:GSU2403 family nucleotidyltransferase fold protein [Planctomycetota bacterium]